MAKKKNIILKNKIVKKKLLFYKYNEKIEVK